MAEETPNTAANQDAPQPSLHIVGQYIKDLSFENPNAPASLAPGAAPQIGISINVGAQKQENDIYAVELTINAKAEREGTVLFNVELVYGGLFSIQNFAENQIHPLVMIECPRLIFPFARQILSTVTQNGGFPPLLMEPVDFSAIYRQNLEAAAAKIKEGEDASVN
ncbi:protein-export chaperone SecB [Maritalea porphyrae]|uniref:Protein-export protein SecB n=1 Tax=Maritalea porphyrae TaxID=880732 RepID=A0ABQ5UPR1_9HYPH|nr:protein-export chaperone SecB [Maritalea porphyrae]GLQ16854.1 protein-export protein SecB [Maritalea porphyrae]